ncbi:MAG: exodeoxyribonuclease VII large subunit [Oscillospiraceae bacterium]|nr:exodeoxyribonuclease VII large subunit [Oscillospiraceae bacterium]
MSSILTVSQLNRYVKSLLEDDRKLKAIYVRGEISNFINHFRSGHCYFTLKEGNAAVKCVMFSSNAQRLIFTPENGMSVILCCGVSLYERDGSYQLYVQDMQPDGKGALAAAFEQLKTKLSTEGLFDAQHKRPLPLYPDKVALITSKTGAALQDMLSIIGERYPICQTVLYDASVQGVTAVPRLISAIDAVEHDGADVVIIGRGGGSTEDLWAFNDEALARRIFAMNIPVISAVGHETDFTICDFVADVRAETPSAAAQIAVPDIREVKYKLDSMYTRIENEMFRRLEFYQKRIEVLEADCRYYGPQGVLREYEMQLDSILTAVKAAAVSQVQRKEYELKKVCSTLEVINPLKLLSMGYTVTEDIQGHRLKSVENLPKDGMIKTYLPDGWVISEIVKHGTSAKGKE